MDQLQALLGKDQASAMVTRMPALLHYQTSTLSHKLDDLYDLLPDADVGKVQQYHGTTILYCFRLPATASVQLNALLDSAHSCIPVAGLYLHVQ